MPLGLYTGPNVSTGNGVTTVFPYTFKINAQADLKVKVAGVEVSTGFTVSGIGSASGGNVTFAVAPANGAEVFRGRAKAYTRATDYQRNGSFDEETVDADFDGVEMQIQQLDAVGKRAIKAPESVSADQVVTDADWAARAGTVFGFDALGTLRLLAVQVGTSLVDLASSIGASLIGFLPGGSGAVSESVQTTLRRLVFAEQYGVVADTGTDQTAALQAAVNAAYGKTLVLPAGTITLSTAGGIVQTDSVHWQGHGSSDTIITRNFSPSADNVGAINLGSTTGTKFSNIQFRAAAGTAGGCLVSGVSTAGVAGGFTIFENCNLTFSAINTYKYALYFDGSAKTGAPIGYRDVVLSDTYVFGGTSGTIYCKGVVQFNWNGGGAFGGGSTSGVVELTGDATVKTQNIGVNVAALDGGLILDFCVNGVIQAGVTGSITNTPNTNGLTCIFGDVSGTIEADWTQCVVVEQGRISFPATQNASSGVNTLDDYEEGTWTPVLTFAVPGDLNVVYSIQLGAYTKVGDKVTLTGVIRTSTFTHTTAAGAASITGLPFPAKATANLNYVGALMWQGITKATYTSVVARLVESASALSLRAAGSGVGGSDVAAADMPTGGTVDLRFTITYLAAT